MQVIGRARTGSFVLPGTYEIPGDRSTAAISLHQQRCEYVRAHQRRRATLGCQEAAALLDKDADLRFDCGRDHTGACAHVTLGGVLISCLDTATHALCCSSQLLLLCLYRLRAQWLDSSLPGVRQPCMAQGHRAEVCPRCAVGRGQQSWQLHTDTAPVSHGS